MGRAGYGKRAGVVSLKAEAVGRATPHAMYCPPFIASVEPVKNEP
jgi:hypothetical protein